MAKKGNFLFVFFFFLLIPAKLSSDSNTYSQTKNLVCPDIGGCKNATFFECQKNECKPISDGKLKVTIKGDYNMSFPQRETLQMKIENFGEDVFGGGIGGVEDECTKEFTFEYLIPKENLENLFQDGKLEIEFLDTNFVDCCCRSERKVSLEYTYLPPLSVSCSASPNPTKVNQKVTFSANVSGGTGNYTWSWSGACTGTGPTCETTFSSEGTYKANLEVDDGESKAQTSCEVKVEAVPTACEKFIDNGSPQDKIDFVFIGDGYSSAEEDEYLNVAQEVANYLLSLTPFKENACKFNFYRVRGSFDFNGREAFAANAPPLAQVLQPIQKVTDLCGIFPEEIQVVVNYQKSKNILGWHYCGLPLAYILGGNLNLPFPANSGHISYHEFGHSFGLPDHSDNKKQCGREGGCPGTICSHCAMCYKTPLQTYGTTCEVREQGVCKPHPCLNEVQNKLQNYPPCP